MEQRKLKHLRKFLEKELIDCKELEKKNDLTKEGHGTLIFLRKIFNYMGWEEPKIRKMCQMTSEENKVWEDAYYKFVKKGVNESVLHDLCDKAVKKKFPRLNDYEVLF